MCGDVIEENFSFFFLMFWDARTEVGYRSYVMGGIHHPLGTNDVMMFINQFVPGRVSHVQIKFNHLIGIW